MRKAMRKAQCCCLLGMLLAGQVQAYDLLDPTYPAYITLADRQLNNSSWAAANLLDDNVATRWLSDRRDNDLIFAFDPAMTERCFGEFRLQNYGGSRSVREFVLLHTMDASLSTDTGTNGWTPIVADPNPSGLINHLHWGQGGRLTAIDRELNSTTWAAAHINNGNLGDFWLSDRGNNTLDFAFDTDWNSSTGNAVNVRALALHNYGGTRSIARFQVEVSQDGATWRRLEVPGSGGGQPDFNFALAHEGGAIDVINRELNSTSWAAANIHDGASQSIWLSDRTNNNLDFSFDPDGDGTTGLGGDADDHFTLERIAIENYGGSRSVRHFQVLVRTATNPEWTAIPVPGSVAGEANFNYLLSHQGGRLSAIDSQLNSTSWAAANVHDGSSQTIWLSSQANNRLDFVFDTDGDGSTAGAGDRFTLESFALENYGSTRSIRDYQVEVMTTAVPVWTKLTVPGSGAGDPGFNFLSVHEGGRLTAINRELNSTSWAAANIHDGSPNSIWLSNSQTNTLDFAFDTDLDGSLGDRVNFTTLRMQNYGSSRSVATFEIDVRRGGGAWQTVSAPGGGTVFNAAQSSAVQSWTVSVPGNVSGVRLRTLTNYGDTYTGIRELEVIGNSRGPSRTFTAAQSAAEQIVNLPPTAQPSQVTAVRLRAINNYGDSSYTGAREFKVLGTSITRSTTFEATQDSAEQIFLIDPADRPTGVTAVRLQTISNYGDTYTGIRELRLLGASVTPSHTFEATDSSARQTFVLDPEDAVSGVVAVRLRTLNNHGDSSYIGARQFEVLGDAAGPSYLFSAGQGVASQSWNFTPVTARLFRLHTTDNFGDTYTGATEIGLETSLTCEALAVWHLDETSWNIVNDSSGNGYTGAASNGPITSYDDPVVPNSPGTCRYGVFDGQDDYLSFPTLPDLTGSFTIAAWIRPNRITGDQRIFADDRNNSGGFAFSLGDGGAGRLRFFSRRVSPVSLDSPAVITTGAWQFVAVVHDVVNRTRSIYLNGGLTPVAQGAYTGTWGTDPGPASVGGEVDGTSEGVPRWRFDGEIDEVTIFQRPLSGAELAALRNQTHICASYEDPNQPAFGFNCVAPAGDAVSGRLPTRLVGSPFVFDVVALQDSDNDNVADAIETRYAQVEDRVVSVELVDTSAGGSCQALPALMPAVSQSVLFQSADAGRKSSAGFSVARAYPSVGCRVTDNNETPAVVGCSTDRFSVRPSAFTLQTPALNNAGSSGAPVLEVEAAFGLSVSSAPGYGGTPTIEADPLQAHAAAITVGTLGGGFGAADASTGVATGPGFSYSEVGNFRFLPNAIRDSTFTAVDQPGDCILGSVSNTPDANGLIGCDFANPVTSPWVGRFIPGRFEVAVSDHGTLGDTCSGFSYAGTAIGYSTDPAILISARADSGAITRNYTGAYSKLSVSEITLSSLSADAGTLGADGSTPVGISHGIGSGNLIDNADGTLLLNLTGDTFTYARDSNSLIGEFMSDVSREIIAVADTEDGTAAIGLPQMLSPGGVAIRYGRVNIANAFGSELQTLPMPMRIEYFAGPATRFQDNAADLCTSIGTLTIADADPGDSLLPADTCIWDAAGASGAFACSSPGAGPDQYRATPLGGDFNLNLMAPVGGAAGALRIGADVPDWLEFDWSGAGNQDPSGVATFGRFRGHDRIIFWRESP